MKLCFVGDGQSIHMINFVKWFAQRNHEVYLITDKPSPIEDVEIRTIRSVSFGLFRVISKMTQTSEWVKEIKPEILHAHYICGYGTYAAAANFHPFILTPWGGDIAIDSHKFLKRQMVKYAIDHADIISSVDPPINRRLIELGAEPRKVKPLIEFGVNSSKFRVFDRIADVYFPQTHPIVLSARALIETSKIEKLFYAIPRIMEKIPSTKFVFVYHTSDDVTMEWIGDKMTKVPWRNSVALLGSVSHEKMPALLNDSDVLVDTLESFLDLSDTDISTSVGATSTEAMFCKVPVVLYRKSKVVNGPYSSYSSIGELVEEVTNILTNEEYKKGILDRASAFLAARGDEEEAMSRWEKLYETLGGVK